MFFENDPSDEFDNEFDDEFETELDDEPAGIVPPVVVVVVTKDPGPWFDETLEALANQDYSNYQVVILDASEVPVPLERIAKYLPSAFVKHLESDNGYSANTNLALEMVKGVTHLILSHDDVRPATNAITLMVEEALRSNAGIIAPKYVRWDDPSRIVSVGMNVDKLGARADRVIPGELDQEQHDAVRDVFIAPGGFVLVRMDLFAAIGGLDPTLELFGEDLDLCWRAQLQGARVLVAPQASVAHIEVTRSGTKFNQKVTSLNDILYYVRRSELRTILKCYGTVHLIRVLPQALVASIAELIISVIAGKFARARSVIEAWRWNFNGREQLRLIRKDVQSGRIVADSAIREYQVAGYVRLNSLMQKILASYHGVHRLSLHGIDGEDFIFGLEDGEEPELQLPGSKERDFQKGKSQVLALESGQLKEPRPEEPVLEPSQLKEPRPEEPVLEPSQLKEPRPEEPVLEPGQPQVSIIRVFGIWNLKAPTSTTLLWLIALILLAFGERHWFSTSLPVLGQLARFTRPWTVLHSYFMSSHAGASLKTVPSLAVPILSLASFVTIASGALLQKVILLGSIPIGAWGMTHLARPFGRRLQTNLATITYMIVPIAYDFFSQGRLIDLVLFALSPWIIASIFRRCDIQPYSAAPTRNAKSFFEFTFVVIVVSSIAPGLLIELVLILIALGLYSFLDNSRARMRSGILQVFGALIISIAVELPTLSSLLRGSSGLANLVGTAGSLTNGTLGVGELVRFHIGTLGSGWVGYVLLAGALVPIAFGKAWRLDWSIRAWFLMLVGWVGAWLASQGYLGHPSVDVGPFLVIAQVALALAIGLAASAYEMDLTSNKFGWRQALSVIAGVGFVLSIFPPLAFLAGGQMNLESQGWESVLGGLSHTTSTNKGYDLWIGASQALPTNSIVVDHRLSFGLSQSSLPTEVDQYSVLTSGAQHEIERDLAQLGNGLNVNIGTELARSGVQNIVVPLQLGPLAANTGSTRSSYSTYAPASWIIPALDSQTQLRKVEMDPLLDFYVNTKYVPASKKYAAHTLVWVIEQTLELIVLVLIGLMAIYLKRPRSDTLEPKAVQS